MSVMLESDSRQNGYLWHCPSNTLLDKHYHRRSHTSDSAKPRPALGYDPQKPSQSLVKSGQGITLTGHEGLNKHGSLDTNGPGLSGFSLPCNDTLSLRTKPDILHQQAATVLPRDAARHSAAEATAGTISGTAKDKSVTAAASDSRRKSENRTAEASRASKPNGFLHTKRERKSLPNGLVNSAPVISSLNRDILNSETSNLHLDGEFSDHDVNGLPVKDRICDIGYAFNGSLKLAEPSIPAGSPGKTKQNFSRSFSSPANSGTVLQSPGEFNSLSATADEFENGLGFIPSADDGTVGYSSLPYEGPHGWLTSQGETPNSCLASAKWNSFHLKHTQQRSLQHNGGSHSTLNEADSEKSTGLSTPEKNQPSLPDGLLLNGSCPEGNLKKAMIRHMRNVNIQRASDGDIPAYATVRRRLLAKARNVDQDRTNWPPAPIPENEVTPSYTWDKSNGHNNNSMNNDIIFNQFNSLGRHRQTQYRSASAGDLRAEFVRNNSVSTGDESDSDLDDFGFLRYYKDIPIPASHTEPPPLVSPSEMQKSKSPSPGHRILPRKWRKIKLAHSKSAPAASSMWTPEGNCQWSSMSGQQVTLSVMNLLQLSEVEILALQKITLAKLQAMELGCPITIPKDALLSQKSRKRSGFMLRRRPISGTNLVGLWDNIKGKDSKDSRKSIVFGIPLSKCLAHDRELRRRKATLLRERRESLDLAQLPRNMRKSSSSSGGAFSSDSLPDLEQRHGGSSLLEALSLTSSTSQLETKWKESHESLQPHTTEVPYVVNMCCKHIETYGLHILGIFRIGSSKKRTKQLKEEFESGEDVKLSKDHNPHEVGALLKEFFRDLPDPLLTRDLYHGFVATRKLESAESRLQALQYLISLLPTANRDTLYTLLKFLHLITKHSVDSVDSSGNMTQGNKMNAHNLATLFGPNILHKAKGGLEKQFQVDQVERAEERLQVISVVEEMVNHHEQLFQVAPSVHDEVFRVLLETNPEAVDFLMKRRLVMMVEPEHTSCYFDESDSSLPRSPVAMSDFEPQKLGTDRSTWLSLDAPKKPVVRIRSADPPLERETNQLQDRVGSMELGSWYRQESRSPSPRSPVIMRDSRNTEPKFRLSVPQHSVDRARSSSAESRSGGLSPKEAFMQRTSPSSSSIDSRLRVPFAYSREGSTSSLSSYPSPVSGSPGSVDFMSSHGFGSGHSTPSSLSSKNDQSDRETSTSPNPHAPLVKASSQQRPLGLVKPKPRPFSAIGFPDRRKDVQYDQWRKWENLARKSGDDFHEQETLV